MEDPKIKDSARPPGARREPQERAEGAPGGGSEDRGRFSSQRKMEAVLRLVRGESLDALSRELGVTGATLGEWREKFISAGQTGLKSRPADERDDEIQRLRAKIGEITMENELLRDRARAAEALHPFAPRRSRP